MEERKKTKTKTKAAKRYLGASNNTNLGFIQCYLPPINCHGNIAIFGTEHSDFTRYEKVKLDLLRSYWCQHYHNFEEEFKSIILVVHRQEEIQLVLPTSHFRGTVPLTVKIDLGGKGMYKKIPNKAQSTIKSD